MWAAPYSSWCVGYPVSAAGFYLLAAAVGYGRPLSHRWVVYLTAALSLASILTAGMMVGTTLVDVFEPGPHYDD
jgi:hypothetical protein